MTKSEVTISELMKVLHCILKGKERSAHIWGWITALEIVRNVSKNVNSLGEMSNGILLDCEWH